MKMNEPVEMKCNEMKRKNEMNMKSRDEMKRNVQRQNYFTIWHYEMNLGRNKYPH